MRRHMRLIAILCLIASIWPIAACGGQGVSSADQIATRVAQDLAVAATLTAVARAQPTAALPNAATPVPTAIPTSAPPTAPPEPPTEAPRPTEAPPEPTDIPIPPTAPPEPTEAPIAYTDVNFSGNPVPGEEVGGTIQIAGAELNDNNVAVVHSFLAIRVFARFPASAPHDGDGVDNVRIEINNDESGDIVQDRTERTAGYCAFQGGEPDCVVWVFAEHDNKWPNGQPITDGTYRVDVTITPVDENNPTVNWNFQFEVAQS